MERIDDLMERLKGQMPQLPDSDALTDSIMAAIDGMDSGVERKVSKHVPIWITLLRTVSSVAAVILVALFIHVEGQEQTSLASAQSDSPITKVSVRDFCQECTLDEIYNIKREKTIKRKQREFLKDKLYASYNF